LAATGCGAKPSQELVSVLPLAIPVGLVIELDGRHNFKIVAAADDEIKMLGADPVESSLPGTAVRHWLDAGDISNPHLAEYSILIAYRLLQYT
jgi:hypothetical protein